MFSRIIRPTISIYFQEDCTDKNIYFHKSICRTSYSLRKTSWNKSKTFHVHTNPSPLPPTPTNAKGIDLVYLSGKYKLRYLALRGLYFGPKIIFIPPSSENDTFSTSRDMLFFHSHRGLLAIILPYFAVSLPFYFPFSHFLSPFFLFLKYFPPFSLCLFIFFPPNDISWYPPPRGGIFQYIDPC